MIGPRYPWIDRIFNRTDYWPEAALAGASALGLLIVVLWLFGFVLPNTGRAGPLTFENSPPATLAWLRTGDEPEAMPEGGWEEHRAWLDANLCAPSASWDGGAERQALARRLSDDARLCGGLERGLARAPLAPVLGTLFSAFVALLLALLAAWWVMRANRAFFHIRRAYRRLYLSEHRTDHEEEAAALANEGR